jgi:hypothetical protein
MRGASIVVPRESRAKALSVRVSPIENSVSADGLDTVSAATRCETTIDFVAVTVPLRAVTVALPPRSPTIVVDGPDEGLTLTTDASLDVHEIVAPDTTDPEAARASADTVTESGMENNESGTGDIRATVATAWDDCGGVESDPAPQPSAATTIRKKRVRKKPPG